MQVLFQHAARTAPITLSHLVQQAAASAQATLGAGRPHGADAVMGAGDGAWHAVSGGMHNMDVAGSGEGVDMALG